MMVVVIIPAIVVIVIAVRAAMMMAATMMVMMPPTVMVMTSIADICAGSPRMSAMGQTEKSGHSIGRSALPPTPDMALHRANRRFVPETEVAAYSILVGEREQRQWHF